MLAVALAAVVAAPPAGAQDAPSTTSSTAPSVSTSSTTSTTADTAATSAVPTSTTPPPPLVQCSPPYHPVYAGESRFSGDPEVQTYPDHPVDRPSVDGRDLGPDVSPGERVDTDGDGHYDHIDRIDGGIEITRGDGRVVLVNGHPKTNGYDDPQWSEAPNAAPGDLNGDGRDDLLVRIPAPAGGDYFNDDEGHWFAVSGAVSPGKHDVWKVGVMVPGGHDFPTLGFPAVLGGVGDQVGGPGDDVLARDEYGSGIVDGETLLAPGPGGAIDRFQISIPIDADLLGPVDLGGARPALLLAHQHPALVSDRIFLWRAGETLDFDPFGGWGFADTPLYVRDSPDGRLLIGGYEDRGGGSRIVVWNIDHPCGPGSTARWKKAPGAAAPAEPVAAQPSFTG